MFIEELILDGFKSYSVRTVLGPFDKQFNAITGLNGSGKSNVLDGICFVLGITNLSKVRAGNLSELVYKQGQAGITKASVTIVFNNSDKSPGRSPVGFENQDVITVCRQIVIGGRNRYLLNGKTAQLQEVYNLFHSVQLNINNPHFLIMQGSITKVINMKPQEILGMIEEAAGTSMYESKKNLALRTLEKKDLKVEEIDRIIKEEIEPQLGKLKAEKNAFIEWSNLVNETNEIEQLVTSWEYRAACLKIESTQFDQTKSDLARWKEISKNLKTAAAKSEEKLKSDVKSLEKQRLVHQDIEAKFEEELKTEKRQLAELETNLKAKESVFKQTSGKQSKSKSAEARLAKQIDLHTAAVAAAGAEFEAAKIELLRCESELDRKQKSLADLSAGTSGTGGDVSLQQSLNEKRSELESVNTELKSRAIKVKGLETRLKSLVANRGKNNSSEYESLENQKRVILDKKIDFEKKLGLLNYNPSRFLEVGELIKTNERRIEQTIEERNSLSSTLAQRLEFQFDPNSANVDPNKQVFGLVAKLLQIKPEFGDKYLLALELVAGAKLFNVVVDSEATCKKLLSSGKLRRRVTILPLDKIQGKRVSPQQLAQALAVAAGEALPAIDAVAFPESVTAALEYVFGSAFVVESSEVGKRVTFNNNEPQKCKSVTADGDVFDPKGSLTGGGDTGNRNGRILAAIYQLQKVNFDLQALQRQTAELQGERSRMASSKDAFERTNKELSQTTHNLNLVLSKLKSTSQSQLADEIAGLELEISAENSGDLASKKSTLTANVAELMKEMKDLVKNKESLLQETTGQISVLKTAKKTASDAVKNFESKFLAATVSLESVAAELGAFQDDMHNQTSLCSGLESEVAALDEKTHWKRDEIELLNGKLCEAKIARESFDKTVAALLANSELEKTKLDEADLEVKKFEALMQTCTKERDEAQCELAAMERDFTWLRAQRETIIANNDLAKKTRAQILSLKNKLSELKDDVNIRGKSINRRIIPLIERSEREAEDLLTKRSSLETEKKLIHEFIEELDDKKGRALSKTWQIVNSNFGAIFRSLLPKVDAKLAPPAGLTALEGLELKVQLGSVWKDSLTELSGGQKSLLALSLVLALLLFKPAPFYILDEVDAALDVSHTRNIGKMIKQYFPHSQFVIVSLKDGMFSNANVLFRVRFENGTSLVTRAEQAQETGGGGVTIEFRKNDEDEQENLGRTKSVPKKNSKKSDSDVEPPVATKRKLVRN